MESSSGKINSIPMLGGAVSAGLESNIFLGKKNNSPFFITTNSNNSINFPSKSSNSNINPNITNSSNNKYCHLSNKKYSTKY